VAATATADDRESTETNRGPIIPFLEATDVFWTVQTGDGQPDTGNVFDELFKFRLEADIFPHLVVAQNFTDVLDIEKQRTNGASAFKQVAYSISGTPAVRLRMFNERSAPVRSPSYMPRGNFQLLWVRGVKDCAAGSTKRHCRDVATVPGTTSTDPMVAAEAALRRIERVSVWEGHFIVGHHSNGQDQCLSTLQHLEAAGDDQTCVPDVPLTRGTVNTKDGSFSTNYMRFGVNYSRNWLDGELFADTELRLKAEVEHHPRAWMDPVIADVYGRTRLNLGAAYAMRDIPGCRKRLEGLATLGLNPGAATDADSPTAILQVSCYAAPNGGWGFFVRFYSGQDYYNAAFFDYIRRLHVGMTFNQSAFFRFRRAAK